MPTATSRPFTAYTSSSSASWLKRRLHHPRGGVSRARAGGGGGGYDEIVSDLDVTSLDPELARQVMETVQAHGAWPELLRRVARDLRYDDPPTLMALSMQEYAHIGAAPRLALLARLCDACLGTAAIRRAVELRVRRIEQSEWAWNEAASLGMVQRLPLVHAPRVESIGKDREHAIYWMLPGEVLTRLGTAGTLDKDGGAAGDDKGAGASSADARLEPCLTSHEGIARLRELREMLSPSGAREAALLDALDRASGGVLAPLAALEAAPTATLSTPLSSPSAAGAVVAPNAAMAAAAAADASVAASIAAARRASAGGAPPVASRVAWPPLSKPALFPTSRLCPYCQRKVKTPTPDHFVEHLCNCAAAISPLRFERSTMVQRQAVRILMAELLVPSICMKAGWEDERVRWAHALKEAASEQVDAVVKLRPFLLTLESSIHPSYFRPGWTPPQRIGGGCACAAAGAWGGGGGGAAGRSPTAPRLSPSSPLQPSWSAQQAQGSPPPPRRRARSQPPSRPRSPDGPRRAAGAPPSRHSNRARLTDASSGSSRPRVPLQVTRVSSG